MPRRTKEPDHGSVVATIAIPSTLLDELVKGPMTAAEVQATSMAFKKAGNQYRYFFRLPHVGDAYDSMSSSRYAGQASLLRGPRGGA